MANFESARTGTVNAPSTPVSGPSLLEKIRRARNYSRVLSRRDAWRLAFATGRAKPVSFAAPALGAPLHLRPGSVDVAVFEKIFLHGEYELPFPLDVRRIIDAGAHIGLASRFFAHRHPDAEIIAVEPLAANLEILRRNVEHSPRIQVRSAAVWGRAAILASSGDASWSHAFSESTFSDTAIGSVTIPEILDEAGWATVDVVKLDVEGAEREIFNETAAAWLPRVRLIVIELHDRFHPGCSAAFYRRIVDRLEAQETRGENVFTLLRK